MLSKLLDLLREGGTRRIQSLADELGTTPELVEMMLEDLTRMGHVKRVEAHCSEKCSTCPMSTTCVAGSSSHRGRSGQIWVLTQEQETT